LIGKGGERINRSNVRVSGRSGIVHSFDIIVKNFEDIVFGFIFREVFDIYEALRMLAVSLDLDLVQVYVVDRIEPGIGERIQKQGAYLFNLGADKRIIVCPPSGANINAKELEKAAQSALEIALKSWG